MELTPGRWVWHCRTCSHKRRYHKHLDVSGRDIARIYALKDPRTGEVRYVGQTVRGLRTRLYEHVQECLIRRVETSRQRWVYGLYLKRLAPAIEELEVVPYMERDMAERRWIAHFKRAGANLVNSHPGGNQITPFDRQIARAKTPRRTAPPALGQPRAGRTKNGGAPRPKGPVAGPLTWPDDQASYSLALRTRIDIPDGGLEPASLCYRLATRTGVGSERAVSLKGQLAPEVAEYHTLVAALRDILRRIAADPKKRDPRTFSIAIYSPRETVIKHIKGEVTVTALSLRFLVSDAQDLLKRFSRVEAIWLPSTQLDWLFRQPQGVRVVAGRVIPDSGR